MRKDSLGDRMKKNYEQRGRTYLTRRTPVILRLDGKAFHTFTKGFARPFDKTLSDMMTDTALFLCENIQGCKLAYVQSDEISLLLTDFDKLTTDAWFDYETSKMNSVASAYATAKFNQLYKLAGIESHAVDIQEGQLNHERVLDITMGLPLAFFDCRAFNIPENEVMNCFRWRYQDWLRNSMQMLAQSHFSHKQLHCKNQANMHDMLYAKGVNWNDLDNLWKNGTLIYKDESEWVKHTDIRWVQESSFDDFCHKLMNPIA